MQSKNKSPVQRIVEDISGLYFILPSIKTHDTYYNGVEVKIPNPTIRTAVVGE